VSLERLRDSFLATVSAEIAAQEEAAEAVRQARGTAVRDQLEGEAAAARAAGRAEAAAAGARAVADARRQAHRELLAARAGLYEGLHAECVRRAAALRGSERERRLVRRLSAELRRRLGDRAQIETDPGGRGGAVGREGARMIDCSLPVLVERSLERLGPEVEELWR